MASGVTRDETTPKEGELGGTLGSHLPALFRALNLAHAGVDLVVAGADTRWTSLMAPKVDYCCCAVYFLFSALEGGAFEAGYTAAS